MRASRPSWFPPTLDRHRQQRQPSAPTSYRISISTTSVATDIDRARYCSWRITHGPTVRIARGRLPFPRTNGASTTSRLCDAGSSCLSSASFRRASSSAARYRMGRRSAPAGHCRRAPIGARPATPQRRSGSTSSRRPGPQSTRTLRAHSRNERRVMQQHVQPEHPSVPTDSWEGAAHCSSGSAR